LNSGNTTQDSFLRNIMQEDTSVAIYLINGIKLTGKLVSFTPHTLFLHNMTTQMIHKKTISTVMPISDQIVSILLNHSKG
jgi:host factor-I protein